MPVVRKPLQTCGHADREPRRKRLVRTGRIVDDTAAVHAKKRPGGAGTGRAEVWSAMFLGPADQRRGNAVGPPNPILGPAPTARTHEIGQDFANRRRGDDGRTRPGKAIGHSGTKSRNDHPWPKLSNPEFRSLEQSEPDHVSVAAEFVRNRCAEIGELRRQDAAHIFDHDCGRANLINKSQKIRKQVAVVLGAKLLSGNREGRARQAPRKEIGAAVARPVKAAHIGLGAIWNPPLRSVAAQGGPAIRVRLDKRKVLKTGRLEAQRLTTGASTDFDRCQGKHRHAASPELCA